MNGQKKVTLELERKHCYELKWAMGWFDGEHSDVVSYYSFSCLLLLRGE